MRGAPDPSGAWQKANIAFNRRQFQDTMTKVMLDSMELECDRFKVRPGLVRTLNPHVPRFPLHRAALRPAVDTLSFQ